MSAGRSVNEFETSITRVLTVQVAESAVEFYHRAFGAWEIYRNTYWSFTADLIGTEAVGRTLRCPATVLVPRSGAGYRP